ncbi:Uncharacterized protein PCOAH_00036640 [Plasmodium coatneyi]|uniref:Transcription factor with AP2 domain(S) n=1 Tax=Plasmodium coatneyi TaxID=208452 RepID=A0A1B1E2P1_9APIC|nr:Uncharacterized protein PCOAH_00036640 [Plasmodium coatneyi]ANQ09293.1 Uncharacterized protein PCOAH_00036640 [Plasmodium coatneyi]
MQSVGLESDPVEAIGRSLSEEACQGGVDVGGDVSGGVENSQDTEQDAKGPGGGGMCGDVRADVPVRELPVKLEASVESPPEEAPPHEQITHNDEATRCNQVNIKSDPVVVIDKVERCLVVEWYENDIRREQRISYKKYGNDKAKLRAKELIEKLKAGITFEQLYPDKGPPIVRVYQDVGVYKVSLIRDRIEREWRVEWTDNETPMKARWSCKKVGNDEAQKRAETFAQSLIEGVFNPILLHKATGTRFSRSDKTVVKINVYMKKNVKRKNRCKILRGGDNPSLMLGRGIKHELRKGKGKHSSGTFDGLLMDGSNMVHRNQAYSGSSFSNLFIKSESTTLGGRTDSNYMRSIEGEDGNVVLPEGTYLLSQYHLGGNTKGRGGTTGRKRNYKPRGNGTKGERIKKTPKEGAKLRGKMARRVKDTMRGAIRDPIEDALVDPCRAAQTNDPEELNLFSCYAEFGNVDPSAFSSNSNHVKNEPDMCDPLCMPYSDSGGILLNCRNGTLEPGAMMSSYLVLPEQYEGYRMGSFMAKGGDYSSRYVYATRSNSYAVYVNDGVEHGALCYGDLHHGDLLHGNAQNFHYGGEDPFGMSHAIRSEYVPGGGGLPTGHCTSGAVLRVERYNPYVVSYGGGGMAPHMGVMRRGVNMEVMHRDDANGGILCDVVGDPQGGNLLPQKSHIKNRKPVRQRICHLRKIKCEEDGNDVEGKDSRKRGERNKETKCLPVGGKNVNPVSDGGNGVGDPLPASHNGERKKRKRSTNRKFKGDDFLLDEELSKYFSTYHNIQLRKNQKAQRNGGDGGNDHVVGDSMGVRKGRRYNNTTRDVHGGGAQLRAVNPQAFEAGQEGNYGYSDVVPTGKSSNSVDVNKNDNVLVKASMIPVENVGENIHTGEPPTKPRRRTKHCKFSRASQSALNRVDTISQKEDSVFYGDVNDIRTSYSRYRANGKRDDSACGGLGSYAVSNLGGMLICDSGFAPQWRNNNEGISGDVVNDNTGGDSSAGGIHPSGLNYREDSHTEERGNITEHFDENIEVDSGVNRRESVGGNDGGELVDFSRFDVADGKTHLMNLRRTRRRSIPVCSDQPSEIHRRKDNLNCSFVRNNTIEFVDNPRGYRVPYEYQSRVFYEHFEVPLNAQKEFELQQRYFARLFSLHILAVGWNANKNARVEDYLQELSDPAFRFLTMGGMNSCRNGTNFDGSPSEKNRPSGELNRGELQNGEFITTNMLTNEQRSTDYCYFNSVGDGTSRVNEDGSALNVALKETPHFISPGEEISGGIMRGEVSDLDGQVNTYKMDNCYGASNVRCLNELGEANHLGPPSGEPEVGDMSKYECANLMSGLNDGRHFDGFAVFDDMLNENEFGGIHGYACTDGVSGMGGPYDTCMMSNVNAIGGEVDYQLGNYQGSNDLVSVNGIDGVACLNGEDNNPNGVCVSSGEGMNDVSGANEEGLMLPNLNYPEGMNPTYLHGEPIVNENMNRTVSVPYDQEGNCLQMNKIFDEDVKGNLEYVQNYMNNVDEGSYEVSLNGGSAFAFPNEVTVVSGSPWEGREKNEGTFDAVNTETVNHYKSFIGQTSHVPTVASTGEGDSYPNLQSNMGITTQLDALAACGREDNPYGVGSIKYDPLTIGEKEAQSQRMGFMSSPYERGDDGLNGDNLDSGITEENVDVTGEGDYLYYNGYANGGMHNCSEEGNYNMVDKSNDDCSNGSPHGNGDYPLHEKVHYEFGHMIQVLPSYEQLEREGSCLDNVVDRQAQSQFDNAHYRFGVCSGENHPSIGDVIPGEQHTDELSGNSNHSGNSNTTPNSYDAASCNDDFKKANLNSTSISTPMTNMKDMNNYEFFANRKMIDQLRFTSNSSTINTEYLPSNLLNSISINNLSPSNNVNEQVQK